MWILHGAAPFWIHPYSERYLDIGIAAADYPDSAIGVSWAAANRILEQAEGDLKVCSLSTNLYVGFIRVSSGSNWWKDIRRYSCDSWFVWCVTTSVTAWFWGVLAHQWQLVCEIGKHNYVSWLVRWVNTIVTGDRWVYTIIIILYEPVTYSCDTYVLGVKA